MKTKRVMKNLSNRLFYTLIVFGAIILLGAGVWAATATSGVLNDGSAMNPGHSIQSVSAPEGCASGQVLTYHQRQITNSAGGIIGQEGFWTCDDVSYASGTAIPSCASGEILIKGSSGWVCSDSCASGEVLVRQPTTNYWECQTIAGASAQCPPSMVPIKDADGVDDGEDDYLNYKSCSRSGSTVTLGDLKQIIDNTEYLLWYSNFNPTMICRYYGFGSGTLVSSSFYGNNEYITSVRCTLGDVNW